MSIAAGSASEVEYQLLLACDFNYIQDETYGELNQIHCIRTCIELQSKILPHPTPTANASSIRF